MAMKPMPALSFLLVSGGNLAIPIVAMMHVAQFPRFPIV